MKEYPEHEKLEKIQDKSQVVGEFLDWLLMNGWSIVTTNPAMVHKTIEEHLAEFFKIDLKKLNEEKEQMLAEIREATRSV